MARKSVISEQTAQEIKEYYEAGFRFCEIANMTGIHQSTVRMHLLRNGLLKDDNSKEMSAPADEAKKEQPKDAERVPETESKPDTSTQKREDTYVPKEKTLKDFKSRDMIKHLYDMGYRIKDNQLICLVPQVVNVKDIIGN